MGELLPYLTRLDEADDARSVIVSDRYGQLPVVHDHEFFSKFAVVIETYKEKNMMWSQRRLTTTDRLPIAAQLSKSTSTQLAPKHSVVQKTWKVIKKHHVADRKRSPQTVRYKID